MRPCKFQIGDRVIIDKDVSISGWIESIRWDGEDFVYSIHLDKPIEYSMLRDLWVAREFEMARELTYPRVNINGTGKQQLIETLKDAHQTLSDAIDVLGQTAPHGRDYQTLPEGMYTRAREDYEKRIAMLVRVRDEILDIAVNVDQQGK